jgi:hypothetical protein
MAKVVWEDVEQEGLGMLRKRYLCRAKVPGGWLVRVQSSDSDFIVFLPDPDYSWA